MEESKNYILFETVKSLVNTFINRANIIEHANVEYDGNKYIIVVTGTSRYETHISPFHLIYETCSEEDRSDALEYMMLTERGLSDLLEDLSQYNTDEAEYFSFSKYLSNMDISEKYIEDIVSFHRSLGSSISNISLDRINNGIRILGTDYCGMRFRRTYCADGNIITTRPLADGMYLK